MSARVFVPGEFVGPLRRRGRRRGGPGARGARPRHRADDRAYRLARPLLAGAARRSRDPRRAASATGRAQPRTPPPCSTAGSSPAARIRRRSAGSRTFPYLARQQRLVFARCGVTDPLSLDDYRRHGGLEGLTRALRLGPEATVDEVLASGLRGRGGAGFPTGIKWRTVARVAADQKYVVCNADEGDSGTFADRMLMEGDPFLLIEGMAIAAVSVGATMGYVYIRSEYPHAFEIFSRAIERARAGGLLGAPCSARATPSTSRPGSAPAPISAARRRRCSRASRASAAKCAPSRRCRRSRACSASRPSSTTF